MEVQQFFFLKLANSVKWPFELYLILGWFWSTQRLTNSDFFHLFFFIFLSLWIQTHMLYTHTLPLLLSFSAHTYTYHAHMPPLVIHACMSISSCFFFFPLQKLTAVLQKSKQFAQGYLDRPFIHSWEPKAPGGFIMRRLLILGFPLEMLDEFHFI